MPRPATSAAVLGCALLLGVSGCEEDHSSRTGSDPAGTGDAQPAVDVMDAGAEPRSELVLDVEEGYSEKVTMVLRQTTGIDGRLEQSPAMTMSFSQTVESVTEEEIVVATDYDPVEVDDTGRHRAVARILEEDLAALGDLTGTTTLDRSGAVLDTELDIPEDAPPLVRTTMQQLAGQSTVGSSPFPGEPVGEGATWTADSDFELMGGRTTSEATYILLRISGDEREIGVEMTMDIDGGAGVSATGEGSGTQTWVPGRLSPVRATTTVETVAVVEQGGEEREVVTETEMEVTSEVE